MRPITERNATAGFLVLRLFLVQFWLLQMIGKARDQESGVTSLKNLSIWAKNVGDWMIKTTPMPEFAVRSFVTVLPFVELTLGVLLFLGLWTRRALIASGVLIVSLDIGLMFQLKHDVVAANTVILIATLIALWWEPANRFSVDRFLARRQIS